MPKQNPYLIKENYKQVEEVREAENKVPSYEEFMRVYEEPVNYNDLEGSSVEGQKGYGPCSYSPYEVNPHKIAGKHINMCGSLDCSYYRRINYNRVGGVVVGGGVTAVSTAGWIGALMATPFTGGASLALAAGLSAGASVAAVGGTVLTGAAMAEVLNGVENELRSKWESEELKQKINSLQRELSEVKYQYKRGELTKNRLREIIREKEARIRELEAENRWISTESAERWREIERLERAIRELKELL